MDIKNKNIQELEQCASKIRDKIIDVVGKNGGHLGSNLGVVELSIALHYVYNSPKDKIVWDVGHQSYAHKILTDREDTFYTIRLKNGIGPFTDPQESKHDQFISGHAGNAVSIAKGLAIANPQDDVIAVIGDASFANGTTLEALNDLSGQYKNLTIIINDNEMSIGENVGAIASVFNRVFNSGKYLKLRGDTRIFLGKKKYTKKIIKPIEKIENLFRNLVTPSGFFNMMGYDYIGPMNGHNLENLIKILKDNNKHRARIIHIKTQKGRGYTPALKDPENFHGISAFNIETGEVKSQNTEIYSNIFGEKIIDLMNKDDKIYAFSAGMIKGTGLKKAKELFPNRVIDTGMTEGHTVSIASAMAKSGIKPYVVIYSTFLQRSYSHILHDVSILNLPVRFIIDRAGIVADDGKTHQGIYDIAYLLTIPNVDIVAPTTKNELDKVLEFSTNIENPLAIRFPKEVPYNHEDLKYEYGKWNEIQKGNEIAIIACGAMFYEIMNIKDQLLSKVNATIVSAAWIRPFDKDYINNEFKKYRKIIILEDGIIKSGFGTEILEYVSDNNIKTPIIRIGLDQKHLHHAKRNEILEEENLRGENLLNNILNRL